MSEYPDSRLRLPVFACIRLFSPVPAGHDGSAGHHGGGWGCTGRLIGSHPPAQEVCCAIL